MRTSFSTLAAAALAVTSTAAAAQDEAPAEPITLTGSVTLASDYRFRGISQTNKDFAIQGGVTANHKSGVHAGFWASNLAGWGTFGGPNLELDLFGGVKLAVTDEVTVDVGLTWYMYPGGASTTDFAEPYVKVSGSVAGLALTSGVAYAPKQEALGNWFATGADLVAGAPTDPGDKEDNLYIWTDAAYPVPGTPVTLKGHIGGSSGNPGLGPNGTSVTPTGSYLDWLVGADFTYKNVTLGIAYIDTDISFVRDAAYLQPSFSRFQTGGAPISDSTVVFTLTAAF